MTLLPEGNCMSTRIQRYLSDSDWKLKENANTNISFSNMQNYISTSEFDSDFLEFIGPKLKDAHDRGIIHIHNLETGGYIPYCSGHNLKGLLSNGMETQTVSSGPPKRFDSAVDQVMNWLYLSQMEFAGAQAFSDFDTLLAPFIKYKKLDYDSVQQAIQKLVFNLNYTMRAASQTPFTNLTLNYGVPKHLENIDAIVGGKPMDFSYGECLDEIEMIDRAFNEIMSKGDSKGKPFTFPILTINLTKRIKWDTDIAYQMAKVAGEWGSYYWYNYIGSGFNEDMIRAMCCRFNVDLSQINGPGGLWNTGEGTGSLGVCTINMSRLGFDSRHMDEFGFFRLLDERLQMSLDIVLMRKQRILANISKMMPFNNMNGTTLKNYFITIGVIGLNEMCMNYLGTDLIANQSFAKKVLQYIREWTRQKQIETGNLINFEMIPGEGSSYSLALKDKKQYPEIYTQGTDVAPYYTSLLIPSSYDIDLFSKLKVEEQLLPDFSGGTIFRPFLDDKQPEPESVIALIKSISKTKVPYFDITVTFSDCLKEHKRLRGAKAVCPNCGSPTEQYTRIVGYYRPVSRWNTGKVQEFKERQYITI
jgi:ribonucleoside-triphosphate reductase